MRFQNYITENINTKGITNNDILYIYKPIKKYIDSIYKPFKNKDYGLLYKNIDKILSIKKKIRTKDKQEIIILGVIDSKELKSNVCKKSHNIKPIKIYVGFPSRSVSYQAIFDYIVVGIPIKVLERIKSIENREYIEDDNINDKIITVVSPMYIQQTITHELSHWMDDALHNKHYTKRDKLWMKKNFDKQYDPLHMYKKTKWEESKTEIEALISEIELYRRTLTKDEWNIMTLDDLLINLKGMNSFSIIDNTNTRKMILKRLHREKLLGKNMR